MVTRLTRACCVFGLDDVEVEVFSLNLCVFFETCSEKQLKHGSDIIFVGELLCFEVEFDDAVCDC